MQVINREDNGSQQRFGEVTNARQNRHFFSVVSVFVAALLFRVLLTQAFIGFASPPDGDASSDQLDYEAYAYQLSMGNGYASETGELAINRMPGTSFSIAPVYLIFGRNFAAARLWMCVLSALTCALTYILATICFDRSTGIVAGFTLALFPNHAYGCLHFLSETPFGFGIVVSTLLTIWALTKSSGYLSATAGLSWGATALIRPHIVFAWILIVIAMVFWQRLRRKKALIHALIFSVCCVLPVLGWMKRNQVITGRYMLCTIGAYTFWGAHNDLVLKNAPGDWAKTSDLVARGQELHGNEIEKMDQANSYAIDFVRTHLSDMPYLLAMKVIRLLSPFVRTSNQWVYLSFALSWLVIGPFMIVGICKAYSWSPSYSWLLFAPFLATVIMALIYYGSPRFRDSVCPLYIIFAASGFVSLLPPLQKARLTVNLV